MMTLPPSIAALLGFARKSGQLLGGHSAVSASLKTGKARLVIIATDLPENRRLDWKSRCGQTGSHYLEAGTKEELGRILGFRESGVLAVTDRQMAEAIRQKALQAGLAQG